MLVKPSMKVWNQLRLHILVSLHKRNRQQVHFSNALSDFSAVEIKCYDPELLVFSNYSLFCVSFLCLSYGVTKSDELIRKHTGKMTTAFLRIMKRDKINFYQNAPSGETWSWAFFEINLYLLSHCIVTPGPPAWWRRIVCLSRVAVVKTGAQNTRKRRRKNASARWAFSSFDCWCQSRVFRILVTRQLRSVWEEAQWGIISG